MNLKNWFCLLASMTVGAVAYYYIILEHPVRFGSRDTPERVDLWRLVVGFILTLLGVVLGALYRELTERQRRGQRQIRSFKALFRKCSSSIDLWIGFCAAPLVFALLMQSTQGAAWPGLIAVALQNGFCCAIIAERIIAQETA